MYTSDVKNVRNLYVSSNSWSEIFVCTKCPVHWNLFKEFKRFGIQKEDILPQNKIFSDYV